MGNVKSYRDLKLWQKAMKLAEACYHSTETFPKREVYGLASQMRRAAVSVASNIAEGHSRATLQAYLNHLSIALGSQSEVETQVELAARLNLVSKEGAQETLGLAEEVGRMLHGLISALENRAGRA